MSLKEQIVNELERLTPDQQQQILSFAKRLAGALPSGTPGYVLLNSMDTFQFDPGAVDEMLKVIEADCERVDWDGWQ